MYACSRHQTGTGVDAGKSSPRQASRNPLAARADDTRDVLKTLKLLNARTDSMRVRGASKMELMAAVIAQAQSQ